MWEEAFTRDNDYLNLVFSKLFPIADSFICYENDHAASSIFVIPTYLQLYTFTNNTSKFLINKHITPSLKKGGYLYGVCTFKEKSGKGYSTMLIDYIHKYYSDKLDFLITRPANEELFRFYIKRGFTVQIHKNPFLSTPICHNPHPAAHTASTAISAQNSAHAIALTDTSAAITSDSGTVSAELSEIYNSKNEHPNQQQKTAEKLRVLFNNCPFNSNIWSKEMIEYITEDAIINGKEFAFCSTEKYTTAFSKPFFYVRSKQYDNNYMLLSILNNRKQSNQYLSNPIFTFPME